MSHYFRKITLLAGGVGGAKIAEGFDSISEIDLSIIGNVADDDFFHGLWVSPDIDTITYSLAKIINRDQGWGLSEESFNSLNMLKQFNQETWMTLGDKDFAGPADRLVDALPYGSHVKLRGVDHFATPKDFLFIDETLKFLDAEPKW